MRSFLENIATFAQHLFWVSAAIMHFFSLSEDKCVCLLQVDT